VICHLQCSQLQNSHHEKNQQSNEGIRLPVRDQLIGNRYKILEDSMQTI
jgi:hypothetical protein